MVENPGSFEGTVVSGTGAGAYFVGLGWVRREIQRVVGFDPYPGTLNLRLLSDEALSRWGGIRKEAGTPLTSPEPGVCGGRLIPALVGGLIPAAVVVPDVTRWGEELLEIVAPVHLRSRLNLKDGDRLRLQMPWDGEGRWPKT